MQRRALLASLAAVRGAAPDPRLHWARNALMRGAALVIGSFLAIFTCLLPGALLAAWLAGVSPARAADLAIAAVYLLTVGACACILDHARAGHRTHREASVPRPLTR